MPFSFESVQNILDPLTTSFDEGENGNLFTSLGIDSRWSKSIPIMQINVIFLESNDYSEINLKSNFKYRKKILETIY